VQPELEPSLPEGVALKVKTNLIEDFYIVGRFNFFKKKKGP